MASLINHAKNELQELIDSESEMDRMLAECVLELTALFEEQEHSGSSAQIVRSLFNRVSNFEPIEPLTGEDSEWCILDYDEEIYAQNKRCPSVFKRIDGWAYYIDQYVFIEEGTGCAFTGKYSAVDITFPFSVPTDPIQISVPRNATEEQIKTAVEEYENKMEGH